MKKQFFLIFICCALFQSCAPKVYSLKGTYPATPIVYYSEKSVDQVWSNIIDLFAQKGIPIKLVDKSSGLIISEPSALLWTYEDKTGNPIKKDAWVVLPKVIDRGNNKPIKPNIVYGSWNIRVKGENGKASINTNLYNLTGTYGLVNSATWKQTSGTLNLEGKSTGNFEKMIYDIIK